MSTDIINAIENAIFPPLAFTGLNSTQKAETIGTVASLGLGAPELAALGASGTLTTTLANDFKNILLGQTPTTFVSKIALSALGVGAGGTVIKDILGGTSGTSPTKTHHKTHKTRRHKKTHKAHHKKR